MYDIRGVFGQDLDSKTSQTLGKASGIFFTDKGVKEVFVGRDNRLSSPELAENFINGLLAVGEDVVDLGIITTPMTYFSWHQLGAMATVMVSASHNPPEYNGFKITLNKFPLLGESYQKIREIAERENFSESKPGSLTVFDLWPDYLERIAGNMKIGKRLKIVVDAGNGVTGRFIKPLFETLGCEVIGLFLESDSAYPNHLPYPQRPELYGEMTETIKKEGADLGFAFDGDGDRVGVYDENGKFIQNDLLAILFAGQIIKERPGAKIVMNISTSLQVIDEVRKFGGELVIWKTGYPFIVEKMREEKAVFGGEISGHFFFADRYYGFDDAFYAAARLLEIVSSSDKKISKLFPVNGQYFLTPEFRVAIPEKLDKFELIRTISIELKKEHPEAKIMDFDGLRFDYEDGWGLIRPSNTQSMLTGRAEARTPEKLSEIKELIEEKLRKYKIELNWDNPIA